MNRTAVLIPGDGIGPEVSDAACRVLDAAGAGITWERHLAGVSAIEAGHEEVLPSETVVALQEHGPGPQGPLYDSHR